MQPEAAKYLRDMLDAAQAIKQYSAGKTRGGFLQAKPVRRHQLGFGVIGEALAQLRRFDESAAKQITDHTKIIGFRNQLLHGYGVVDDRIT
jgi:uncharacterized protein with HEPN domain